MKFTQEIARIVPTLKYADSVPLHKASAQTTWDLFVKRTGILLNVRLRKNERKGYYNYNDLVPVLELLSQKNNLSAEIISFSITPNSYPFNRKIENKKEVKIEIRLPKSIIQLSEVFDLHVIPLTITLSNNKMLKRDLTRIWLDKNKIITYYFYPSDMDISDIHKYKQEILNKLILYYRQLLTPIKQMSNILNNSYLKEKLNYYAQKLKDTDIKFYGDTPEFQKFLKKYKMRFGEDIIIEKAHRRINITLQFSPVDKKNNKIKFETVNMDASVVYDIKLKANKFQYLSDLVYPDGDIILTDKDTINNFKKAIAQRFRDKNHHVKFTLLNDTDFEGPKELHPEYLNIRIFFIVFEQENMLHLNDKTITHIEEKDLKYIQREAEKILTDFFKLHESFVNNEIKESFEKKMHFPFI